jgi:steroid 5-alpha reductase family enzyme
MTALVVLVSLGLAAAMSLAWAIQRRTRNAGWVDVVWTFATGLAGILFALAPVGPPIGTGAPGWRAWVVAILVAVWSLRLGLHIAERTGRGPEDTRYAAFHRDWGAGFEPKMFGFLQLQALFALLLSCSMLLAARDPAPGPRLADLLGVLVLAASVAGEALADRQLRRFRADAANKGRVCDAGLWRFSRHPNYFFEWLGWVAYPLFAISLAWPWGWLALSAPAVMYWLLVHVSGIPPLEAQMLKSRGDAFRRYQARTNAFFPGPSRSNPPPTSAAP